MKTKYEYVHELWLEQVENISKSPYNWMAFLKTSAYMFKFPFQDQLLIHAQRPNATACASFEIWNEKLNRWIRKGSKGIALLNNDNTLRYVFDIKDTRSPNFKKLNLWKVDTKDESEYIEMIENKYGSFKSTVDLGQAIIEMSSVIAEENIQDYLAPLLKFRKDSELEYMEEEEIIIEFKSLLTNSVAFEIMHRSSLNVNDYFTADDFYAIRHFNSIDTIMQLGAAGRDLCEMGMNDISAKAKEIMIRTFEHSKQIVQNRGVSSERSNEHERIDIQPSGRLFDTKSENRGTDLQQQIRKDEIQISQRELSGTSSRIESEERTERTSENSRSGSEPENRNTDGTVAEETPGSEQGNKSDGVGTAHEQSEGTGRGNNLSRDNLQLDLGIGGEEINNNLPPFDLSDLPQLLREDISLQHSREEIQQFFMEHTNDMERAEYLAECYDDTLVETFRCPEKYDYSHIGYKKHGNGLDIWHGGFENKKSRSHLSFFELQYEVAKLIENDEYLRSRWERMSPIQKAFENGTMNRNVDYYLFSHKAEFKHTSAEVIEFFSQEKDSQKRIEYVKDMYPDHVVEFEVDGVTIGFKKEEQHLHIFMGTYDRQKASLNYRWSLVVNEIDGMILSRYYDPSIQILTEEEQRTAIYKNEEALRSGQYFSQEEIDRILTRGSGVHEGKFRIYQHMKKHQSIAENVNFLRNEYGIGGAYPSVGYIDEWHDGKGITITKSKQIGIPDVKHTLKWKYVARRINELIVLDRYLTPNEKEKYPQFLQKQMEKQLEYERKMLNNEPTGIIVNESAEEVNKDYQWKIGDIIYKGIDEYTIIENGEKIAIQNSQFPLFIDYVSREEFKNLLKENPLNDKLLVEIHDEQKQTKNPQELLEEYLPVFIDRIQRSEYYPNIKDKDTDVQEAESIIRWVMMGIMASINTTDEEIYNLYTTDEAFRDKVIGQLIDKVYNDISSLSLEEAPESNTALQEPTADISDIHQKQEISDIEPVNYHIDDEHLGAGTPKERYKNNIAAIRLLFSLEKENRFATKEEQDILAKYVGWGGLADVFDDSKSNWSNEYHELKNLLSDEEYSQARESTLTSFYTPPVVIESIYHALENFGFRYGNMLEPACGTGNFMGLVPETLSRSRLYGIELDSITGRIAKKLYPNASIAVEGYEKTNLPDSFFDVAVGNVPFGQFSVTDKKYDKYHFNIHDYFFAKTIDKVRPGGIIAFLTSRFTMDKANSSVRKYINERAELLGAIRLPNNTFSESANTKAVSDIIFLQKRERPAIMDAEWITTETDEQGNVMNSYFISHPDMVLGNVEKTKSMYGREDLTVEPFKDRTLKELLQTAVQSIQGHMEIKTDILDDNELESSDEIITIPADPNVRNFSYTLVDGEVYFREDSQMAKIELSKTSKNRIIGMIEIRDCIRNVIEYQKDDYPDSVIEQEQKKLNNLYDSFTKEYGLINSRGNSLAFRDDSSYYLLCSLENLDEEGKLKSKADIFTKRTIRRHIVKEKADTSQEALMMSLNEKGKIDFDYMTYVTGFDKDKIINDLYGVIYKIPNIDTPAEEKYVTADEYLSGNIREKLKIAELSANIDPQYRHHVESLKQAMPEDLSASQIAVRIGATWIEPETYQQFMFELLSTGFISRRNIQINFSKITGEWYVSNKNYDRGNAKAEKTYGTQRANAYRLIEDCLNLKSTKIYDYEYDEDGRKVAILNKKETMIAQQKQDSIKEAFKNWIWKDHGRREKLTRVYNELFNSFRPREYNGDHLEFPNMNSELTLRKHQKDAIARILYGGNALLAHVVGAGKTFEMTAACMELKRLGLSQKAMFVVPNHLIEQWGSEFLQLYPSANILVARKQDFEKSKRKNFCSRIATGDYDAIIIGHSMFEKIPVSVERQRQMIEDQIEEITRGIQDLKINDGANYSVKQLEKTKKSLMKRLETLNSNERKDDVICFEELGVDRLFVDESHNYKNLFLYTKMRNVAGLSQSEAQKSSDMFMKCQYLDEISGGRVIVFATGTPVSNSMTEMYTNMRYLQYRTLKKHGLIHFDSWASTFGETVNAIELAPEGTGYRMRTRFAQFYNLPELINMFKEVADIKTADMLNLPVPTAHYEAVSVKPSEMQKEIVASLAERAELVRSGNIDPTQDNMLKITNDGRKLALDQRLINPLLPDHEDSKVNACIKNVIQIYEDTDNIKATQLIFCDMSTPSKSLNYLVEQLKEHGDEPLPYTNVYDDIAAKLIRHGIPSEEIAYIHDASTDTKKKELFSKVRSGKVRILLGSTQKMGAGTNVQDLLIATHDLDCPWRPSDLEQRAGRIVRQGNTNSEVTIYRYVTEQTFDAYLYQLVENKQKFISQIMTSKSPVRSAEDIDEASLSYAEIKALASGNPLIKEKMDLDIQVGKLKLAKANFLSEKYDLEDKIIQYYPKKLAMIREYMTGYEKDLNETGNVENFVGMTLQGTFYEEKEQAGNALLLICKQTTTSEQKEIGQYRGFELKLCYDSFYNHHMLTLRKNTSYQIELGSDVYGNITRIDNAISAIAKKLEQEKALYNEIKHQFETAKEEVKRTFEKEEELNEKMARLSEVNKELDIGKSDEEMDMEQDAGTADKKRNEISR